MERYTTNHITKMDETQNINTSNEGGICTEYGSTSKTSEKKIMKLNEVYEMIGLGPSQYLYWLLTGLLAYSDYVELIILSVILPSLRCEWDLTSSYETAVTVSVYGSYALFAVLIGPVADKYGRKTVTKWSTLFLLLAAIVGAASPNKWVFLVTRLLTGACIGINLSCIICYGTEFAESRYRVYGITVLLLSSALGIMLVSGVAFLALEKVGWRWFIIIASLPAVPALVLMLVLPDSPRFFSVSGKQDEAMHAVRLMAKLNGNELPEDVHMECSEDHENLGSISSIFSKDHKNSTVALSVIYFSNIFIEFGLLVLLPLLFITEYCGATAAPEYKCQLLTQDDLMQLTIATAGTVFGVVAAMICAQHIGRLMPIRVVSFLMMISIGLMFVCVNETFTTAITTMAKITEGFVNTIVWFMIPESFPTNIRSTATGFINGCGKIGGVLETGSVYLLFYVSPYSVIGLFLLLSVVTFIGTVVYDRETRYEVLKDV